MRQCNFFTVRSIIFLFIFSSLPIIKPVHAQAVYVPPLSKVTYSSQLQDNAIDGEALVTQIKNIYTQRMASENCPVSISVTDWVIEYTQVVWTGSQIEEQISRAVKYIAPTTSSDLRCYYALNAVGVFGRVVLTRTYTCPDAGTSYMAPVDSTGRAALVCNGSAKAICPVAPLTQISDTEFSKYETGPYAKAPDVDPSRVTQATIDGAQCIIREAANEKIPARINVGYRPPAYQAHIREVYDKWQQLKDNTNSTCAQVKEEVRREWERHGPFAHQPGKTSNHPSGKAMDIWMKDYSKADTIAARCNMKRPLGAADRVHFEPIR